MLQGSKPPAQWASQQKKKFFETVINLKKEVPEFGTGRIAKKSFGYDRGRRTWKRTLDGVCVCQWERRIPGVSAHGHMTGVIDCSRITLIHNCCMIVLPIIDHLFLYCFYF